MPARIIGFVVAVVLAAMAISLWPDARVAALGAGAAAAHCAFSAIRGRCFGGVCTSPAADCERDVEEKETGRE